MVILIDKYVRFNQHIEIISARIDIACFLTKMYDNNYNKAFSIVMKKWHNHGQGVY